MAPKFIVLIRGNSNGYKESLKRCFYTINPWNSFHRCHANIYGREEGCKTNLHLYRLIAVGKVWSEWENKKSKILYKFMQKEEDKLSQAIRIPTSSSRYVSHSNQFIFLCHETFWLLSKNEAFPDVLNWKRILSPLNSSWSSHLS